MLTTFLFVAVMFGATTAPAEAAVEPIQITAASDSVVAGTAPRCTERRAKRRTPARTGRRRQARTPRPTGVPAETAPTAENPTTAESAPAAPTTPAAPPAGDNTTAELLREAQRLYDNLDYDKVPPLVARALAQPDITTGQRCDAYRLQGLALAIIGDPTDADKSFRELLHACPDFDLIPDTAPRVLAAFRSVQVDVQARRARERETARQELIDTLAIEGDAPPLPVGGLPIKFSYRLRDPRTAVRAVHVLYRRATDSDYSSLPLQAAEDQTWAGEIPGGWSVNEDGFVLHYFVTTADEAGEVLRTLGDASHPLTVDVSPGSLPGDRAFYKTVWFWAVTATGVLAAGAASAVAVDRARQLPETDLGTTSIR